MMVGGYDPAQVRAAIDERDERLVTLERQAQELAKRVIETEEKLQAALPAFGRKAAADTDPKAIGALSRRLEEIHGQARKQATRIRMMALEDAVQISDRVAELTKLRDELGSRVQELAGKAGIALGSGEQERPAVGTVPAAAVAEGVHGGVVEIEVGPLRDFAQLSGFEDAVRGIEGAGEVKVTRFSGGRATVSVQLGEPVDLLRELTRRAPFDFRIREESETSLVIDVADPLSEDAQHAA
jgi:hypothetical protein